MPLFSTGYSSQVTRAERLIVQRQTCLAPLSLRPKGYTAKQVFFFLKIGKAWRKSPTRAKRASLARLVPDLLFDCSRVPEYAKIRTVLQSTQG